MSTKKNSKVFNFVQKIIHFFSNLQKTKIVLRSKLFDEMEPIKATTILSLIPFFIAFYHVFHTKYPSENRSLFFSKNLPLLTVPTEKINLETFLYFLKNSIEPKKIYWSDNKLLIETYSNNQGKQLVTFIPLKKGNNNFLSQKLLITLNKNPTDSLYDFYKNLDEIPFRLQSYESNIDLEKECLIFIKNNTIDRDIFANLIQSKQKKPIYLLQKFQNNSKNLIGFTSEFKSQPRKKFTQTAESNLLNKINILGNELHLLFKQGNLIPRIPIKKNNTYSLNYLTHLLKTKNIDVNSYQRLIRNIDRIYQPQPINIVRGMSGYNYPDMIINEVSFFLIQNSIFNRKNIQISFPSAYLFPQLTLANNDPIPEFSIYTLNQKLEKESTKEIHYEGPGILLDKKAGFDWELENPKTKILRDWVETYLSATNPTSDLSKNYFGVYESLEMGPEKIDKSELTRNYWVKNLPIHQKGTITNNTPSFFPYKKSFQLPFFTKKEWAQFIESDLKSGMSRNMDYGIPLLPIIETRIPISGKFNLIANSRNSIEYGFLEPTFSWKPKFKSLDYLNFNLYTSSYSPAENFSFQLSSGKYQNTPSFLNRSAFYDLWEPLTFNSWLIISQLGFAFLVFQTLRALADNYGRELLVYLLDLVALLGFVEDNLKQEIEILMGHREKGFRIIQKIKKDFSNIGGIQNLLPEIVEIVWFLRNGGREFHVSKTLPRGILLTGPPGTGKTLLVQALAGEAEVPVLASSGSSLLEPGESGALKLEILFQEARRLAPCIVFIDEIDTIAQKREQVLQNPMGADEILESLSNPVLLQSENHLLNQNFENIEDLFNAVSIQQEMHKEKLRLLTQLLVELDGMKTRDGVIVIGATNRSDILDSAVLRPGRFDKILEIGLPTPEKRYQILNLYSRNLGISKTISWDYLINRTRGYSAADLASIMNQSTLHAILEGTSHTIETIELGIDRITTFGFDYPTSKIDRTTKVLNTSKNIFILQLAYYQAGKILLSYLLENTPSIFVSYLWPRRINARGLQIQKNLQQYFFKYARRIDIEQRLISCYAGKAAEILFLQELPANFNLSDYGFEDIQFAQILINSMIENWYLYSKNILNSKNSGILTNFNEKEYRTNLEKVSFFKSFITNSRIDIDNPSELDLIHRNSENSNRFDSQNYSLLAHWQNKISSDFELATRKFSDWYRLYLPEPEQNDLNLEWVPPDEFYNNSNLLEKLSKSINWNEFSLIKIHYEKHNLILQSFNKSIELLHENRELLDKLAFELLHKEILREPEIKEIFQTFGNEKKKNSSPSFSQNIKEINTDEILLNKSWGSNSRRILNRFIKFKKFFREK